MAAAFPGGPLDVYRQKASFSCTEMLDFLEGPDIQAFKVEPSELGRGAARVFTASVCGSDTSSKAWRWTRCSPAGPVKTCPWTGGGS